MRFRVEHRSRWDASDIAMLNPTYEEVCSGRTGHAEVVLVVHDPAVISYEKLLSLFWGGHNPTQGFRENYDIGSQYRSIIIAPTDAQFREALASRSRHEEQLALAGNDRLATEIELALPFYYAEEKHQQYLARHRGG